MDWLSPESELASGSTGSSGLQGNWFDGSPSQVQRSNTNGRMGDYGELTTTKSTGDAEFLKNARVGSDRARGQGAKEETRVAKVLGH